MNRLSIALLISSSSLMLSAYAQTPPAPPSPPPFFNGQGIVLDTMREALIQRFERLDENEDGVLSGDELPAPLTASKEQKEVAKSKNRRSGAAKQQGSDRKRDRQSRRGDRARGGGSQRSLMPAPTLDTLDRNEDGEISREEMTATVDVLAQLDVDGDGTIDQSEMAVMREFMRRGGRRANE